jgi:antitoxin CptB
MTELGKLRWQCRRGSRELDLLLNNYLQTQYPLADEDEKTRFTEILKLDDPEMLVQFNLLSGQTILNTQQKKLSLKPKLIQ